MIKKAVILAGGKGTRLLPLTLSTPKPLIQFFDKSLCEKLVLQLKSAGISEVIISVGYLKEKIKDVFKDNYQGVKINYIEENEPLGTAGGLYFAKSIFNIKENENILIVSGDCLFDFDLNEIISRHEKVHADTTVVTSTSNEPLEYGIVNSDENHKIFGFNEKPSWSQVTGNHVNTGIYIINSKVFDLIPSKMFDFSNDLFPLMLDMDMFLYEFNANGFWSDIGTVESYYHSNIYALSGKIKNIPETSDKMLKKLEKSGVKIIPPVYIHDNCNIESGCVIGPDVVISDSVIIKNNTNISNAIIHKNCKIGANVICDGVIICKDSSIGNFTYVSKNAIIKENSQITEHSFILENTILNNNSIGEENYFQNKKVLIQDDEILIGKFKNDNTENTILQNGEKSLRISSSIVSALIKGAKIGIMHDKTPNAKLQSSFFVMGTENSGARTYNFDGGFENLAKYLAITLRFDSFIYVFSRDEKVFCKIFNKNALPPSHDFERRLENTFFSDIQLKNNPIFPVKEIKNSEFFYENEIEDCLLSYCNSKCLEGFCAAFLNTKDNAPEFYALKKSFVSFGGEIFGLKEAYNKNAVIIKYSENNGIVFEQGDVCANRYSLIAAILQTEKDNGTTEFLLPFTFPEKFKHGLLKNQKIFSYPIHSVKSFNIPQMLTKSYHWVNDDILLAAKIISLLCTNTTLSSLVKNQENCYFAEKTIQIPDGISKADIMQHFSNKTEKKTFDSYEGAVIEYPDGKITIIPTKSSYIKLYAEANNSEVADLLFDITEKNILSCK